MIPKDGEIVSLPFANFSCPISQEAGHKEGGMTGVIEDFAFHILVSFP
jgi:hypothetical protein